MQDIRSEVLKLFRLKERSLLKASHVLYTKIGIWDYAHTLKLTHTNCGMTNCYRLFVPFSNMMKLTRIMFSGDILKLKY